MNFWPPSIKMNNTDKVCVLLPVYNEEKNIEACLKNVKDAFPNSYILVVDNNSTDKSASIARAMGVTVISELAQGKGNAVSTGVRNAQEAGCRWIALHDSDNEYDAHDLAVLVAKCRQESEDGDLFVMGVGLREVSLGGVLFRSLIANLGARIALNLSTAKLPPSDILTGARVLSAELARKAFHRADGQAAFKGFELETALTRQALLSDSRLVESPVRYVPRPSTEKKIKAWDMVHILKAAWGK